LSDSDHAALMDGVYRYQRYIYDLTRKYYLFGRDRLIAQMKPAPASLIVEIGCGTARNLIRMAKRYPGVALYGLDASAAMLETARARMAAAGFADRIRLAHGYAENLSPATFGLESGFDHAVFSYSLSMIPDWKQALEAASRSLKPGGRIHIVDFADLAAWPGPLRAALRRWLSLFHVEPHRELLEVLAAASEKTQQYQLLGGRYAVLWRGPADAILGAMAIVARQSQRADKSPSGAVAAP